MKPPTAAPLLYVPGADRKADELAETYKNLNVGAFAETSVERERDPSDPFGLKEMAPLTDNYQAALDPTQRLVRFFSLLCQEGNLGPRAGVFMMELTALNVLNADDVPLSPEEINEVRQAAFEYYQKVRKSLPTAAAPAKPTR